jgi:hypothetical protein
LLSFLERIGAEKGKKKRKEGRLYHCFLGKVLYQQEGGKEEKGEI